MHRRIVERQGRCVDLFALLRPVLFAFANRLGIFQAKPFALVRTVATILHHRLADRRLYEKSRSFDDEWLPLEPKCLERYRHRPCSTQLTGILTLLLAAIRAEVFSTRFCFAPTSSSPSMNSTRTSTH